MNMPVLPLALLMTSLTTYPTGAPPVVGAFQRSVTNPGTFAVGLTTTVTAPAPPGPYFVRVVATNACGNSAPSAETSFVIGSRS